MRIVLTGGGTGGHITPFEPIIAALRTLFVEQKDSLPSRLDRGELSLTFLGSLTPKARELFAQYDVPAIHVPSGKLRRYASGLTIIDLLFRLPVGVVLALIHVWRVMPDVVISKGGYGSVPVVLAAVFYRIPILLHESDAVPGISNVLTVRFATAVAVGFVAAKKALGRWEYKTIVTGTPTHLQLRTPSRQEARTVFELPEHETVVLVFGGSQGAKQLNEALLQVLPSLIVDFAIIHATGPNHFQAVSTVAEQLLANSPRKHFYKPYPYLGETMPAALVAADAVVSRAGATTLAELAHIRKPALLVPLASSAHDHQRKNAEAYEAAGAALVLDPNNVGKHLFEQNIRRLAGDQELRAALQKNLATMDYPNAARDIAQLAFQLARGLAPQKVSPSVT